MSSKILKFHAVWCQPCKELSRRLSTMCLNVDEIDVDENDEIVAKYGIRSVPTMLIVDESGNELSRLVGLKTAAEISQWMVDTGTSST